MTDIAILLCAGFATRMGELARDVPKALLPVADRPVLDYFLDQLRKLDGLSQIHVVSNTPHFAAFEAWAASHRPKLDIEIVVHDDRSTDNSNRLGAVGDLAFVLERLKTQPEGALVAAGDNILRFALSPMWQRFRTERRDFVLALRELDRQRLQRTGVLVLGDDDRVLAFHEKPQNPPSHWACPPIYFLTHGALAQTRPHLDGEEGKHDEIGHFIATLTLQQRLRAFRLGARGEERLRLDIGSPASYRAADEVLRRNPVLLRA